jgi:Family of unknown function (DUF6518)
VKGLRQEARTRLETASVRTWLGILIVVGCGVGIGLAGQAGDQVPGAPAYITALGAPWMLLAFALGALCRKPLLGALAGGAALVIGTEAYYLALIAETDGKTIFYATAMGIGWGGAAAVAGGLAGAVGGWWRSECSEHERSVAGALPGALLTGEALLLSQEWTAPGARALIAAELMAGLGLLWIHIGTSRRVLIAGAAACALTMAVVLGEHSVRETLHAAGWNGA